MIREMGFVGVMLVAMSSYSWNSMEAMETDGCVALTNKTILCGDDFRERLETAKTSTNMSIKIDAFLLDGIAHHERYFETANLSDVMLEAQSFSNAVLLATNDADWRYYASRWLYSTTFSCNNRHRQSYEILTNALVRYCGRQSQLVENDFSRALVRKYEIPEGNISVALNVMAGMSAAGLHLGDAVTNFANQVSSPHARVILELLNE